MISLLPSAASFEINAFLRQREIDIAVNQIKREIAIDDKMCEKDLCWFFKDLFNSNTDSERLSQSVSNYLAFKS